MLKVRQNNENHCATFCGKPVETVETVENAHSANNEKLAELRIRSARQSAKAHSKQRSKTRLQEKVTNILQNSKIIEIPIDI